MPYATLGSSRETRTAVQHPARHRRGAGCAGAHPCRAHAAAHRRAGHRVPAHLRLHSGALRHLDRCSAARCRAASARKSGPSSPIRCIHADWTHFGVNAIWLLPFGSAVARRFGALRFLAFFAVTAAAGAAVHLGDPCRRASADDRRVGGDFRHHGGGDALCVPARRAAQLPARAARHRLSRAGDAAHRRAARSARARLPGGVVRHQSSVRARLVVDARQRASQVVAWQAHIGGFLAGLLLFSWFDPAPQPTASRRHLVQCRINRLQRGVNAM